MLEFPLLMGTPLIYPYVPESIRGLRCCLSNRNHTSERFPDRSPMSTPSRIPPTSEAFRRNFRKQITQQVCLVQERNLFPRRLPGRCNS